MAALDEIETIVIVMMENRSFDNVLGHLRLPRHGQRLEVDGLGNQDVDYENWYDNQAYSPFAATDRFLKHDLPHVRDLIHMQLDVVNGNPTMAGFVRAFVENTHSVVNKPPPMGYLTPRWVPMSGFMADEYAICNRWFSPLPTGTQPNRAVAFTGCSLIDDNTTRLIPYKDMVFDWLNERGVRWRVYHSGLSFFVLFGLGEVLGDNFQSIRRLVRDVKREPPEQAPQVVFIEPEYADSPVHLGFTPNDNHPPLPIGPGEVFLRDIYTALTSNPAKWARTLLLVTYDEHGGYYDHVAPPAFLTEAPPGAGYDTFEWLGVRVPTFAISPWVPRRSVSDALFDHTSILQLLGEKFGEGPESYSGEVTNRRQQGIRSVSELLTLAAPRGEIPEPPSGLLTATTLVQTGAPPPANENQVAFRAAARALQQQHPEQAEEKFPEIAFLPDDEEGGMT